MIRVKATREGLLHHPTASGYVIDQIVPFVALPSIKALHRFVKLHNPANGRMCFAIVLDVGPWNIHDDAYVFRGERPQAETGTDATWGRETNGAGIDLSEAVWARLGMQDNGEIEWEFIDGDEAAA